MVFRFAQEGKEETLKECLQKTPIFNEPHHPNQTHMFICPRLVIIVIIFSFGL